jgi:hypothetical protein
MTPFQQRIAGGIFVGFVLVVASDFTPTAQLAVAFAYLILISSALVVGPAAFDNVSRMVGARPRSLPQPGPGHGR